MSSDVDMMRAVLVGQPMQAVAKGGAAAAKVSDEQYAKMTPAQRLDYARSFDQTQYLARGTRTA